MSLSATYNSKYYKQNSKTSEDNSFEREKLTFSKEEIFRCLGFLLSMSMVGLNFPLGYILIPVCLLSAFKKDRYGFVVMVTLFCGGYNFISSFDIHFELVNIAFLIGLGCMAVLRKPPILKRVTIAISVYALALILLAMQSDESLKVQYIGIRNYLCIIYLFFPFVAFSGKDFDIKILFRKLFLYSLCICSFYIIDSVIFGGAMLLPRDASFLSYDIVPKFYALYIDPISSMFIRRWPLGLYILALCVFPLVRYYKLSPIQWALIIGALLISRTFTVTIAFVIGAILSVRSRKTLFKFLLFGVVTMTALYFIDGTMGETITSDDEGNRQTKHTTLRIKSQIDQLFMLDIARADEDDLAMLGTGRGAQILPKLALLFKLDKEWTGLGFLSRELTTNKKYIIDNDLYGNPEKADEVAIGVESAPFDIFLTIGYIGLIVHTLIWIWLWFIIKRLKYSGLYVITAIIFAIIGIGGGSLNSPPVLYLVSISYAAVILANKRSLPGFSLPESKTNTDQKAQLS